MNRDVSEDKEPQMTQKAADQDKKMTAFNFVSCL